METKDIELVAGEWKYIGPEVLRAWEMFTTSQWLEVDYSTKTVKVFDGPPPRWREHVVSFIRRDSSPLNIREVFSDFPRLIEFGPWGLNDWRARHILEEEGKDHYQWGELWELFNTLGIYWEGTP